MRKVLFGIVALALFSLNVTAQTADEIVAKHLKAIGGVEKIKAIKTYRATGKFTGGGGFEAGMVIESKRPNMVRQDFILQGMTGVSAYDGKKGWKIEPWQGKKDAEPLSEEELKQIVEDSDLDGPLVDYKQKGHKIELVGKEATEGTDAYKLKVTLKSGDIRHYFIDADQYVPIKVESKRMIRGTEVEIETSLGDYKEVAGVYMPYSTEFGAKGSANKAKIVFEKMEVNVPIDDSRFAQPAAAPKQATPAKTPEPAKKPEETGAKKPPVR